MLIESGDLIPVLSVAVDIPWTRRRAQVLNCLHVGSVDFQTHVYDTNVGDIAPLSTYFNPLKWTESDLNCKFGIKSSVGEINVNPPTSAFATVGQIVTSTTSSTGSKLKSASLIPRLLILSSDRPDGPERNDKATTQPRPEGLIVELPSVKRKKSESFGSIHSKQSSAFQPYKLIKGSEKLNENAFVWERPRKRVATPPQSRTSSVSSLESNGSRHHLATALLTLELMRCPDSKELLSIFGIGDCDNSATCSSDRDFSPDILRGPPCSANFLRPTSSLSVGSSSSTSVSLDLLPHCRSQAGLFPESSRNPFRLYDDYLKELLEVGLPISCLTTTDTRSSSSSLETLPGGTDGSVSPSPPPFATSLRPGDSEELPKTIADIISRITDLEPWLFSPWNPPLPRTTTTRGGSMAWEEGETVDDLERIFQGSPLTIDDADEDVIEASELSEIKRSFPKITDFAYPLEITDKHLP